MTPNRAISQSSEVESWGNRVVISGRNVTSAWVFVFVDSNNKFEPFFNFTFKNYTQMPKIEISEKLTKVAVLGKFIPHRATSVSPIAKVDAYHLDYAKKTYTNITFPIESINDTDTAEVKVSDSFIYVREQVSKTNTTGKK